VVALPRRTVLGLAGAGAGWLAMAGCSGVDGPAATPSPTAPPPPDPLLAELADERRLVALYTATAARHPALAVRLGAPQADHTQHAEALVRAMDDAGSPVPTVSGPPSPPPRVPATAAAALAGLRAAERAAAAARSAAALAAPAHRAGLLASVAASESTHRLVLG
jgi:hypothetical protein